MGKDAKKAAELQKEIFTLNQEAKSQAARDMGWFQTYKEGDKAVLGGQSVTKKGGKWVNDQGKEVTSASAAPTGASPTMGSRNYTVGGVTYDWKTGRPITPGTAVKPSPLFTPTAGAPGSPAAAMSTQAATRTASSLGNLDKKAGEQIKKTTEVTTAIKDLSKKTTGQTSLQSTVTAIYQLLNSGSLRVQGGLAAPLNPNTGPPPRTNLAKTTGGMVVDYRLGDPNLGGLRGYPTTGSNQTIVDASFTINQQPGQDAEELASLVAIKLGEAVADARSASLFV